MNDRSGIKNYNVAVREHGDQIVFLRQMVLGAASKSYGIHVARLAGLSGSVVERAGGILDKRGESPVKLHAVVPRFLEAIAKWEKNGD